MAMSLPPLRPFLELADVPQPAGGALARVLTVALAYGAASVPAFAAGAGPLAWGLAVLSVCLALRFPMAGLCATIGSGAYLLLTLCAVASPDTLGASGLWHEDPLMQACAWLTLLASVLGLALLDVNTFRQAFRAEGRPLAHWRSAQVRDMDKRGF